MPACPYFKHAITTEKAAQTHQSYLENKRNALKKIPDLSSEVATTGSFMKAQWVWSTM